jgi:hypothetical protein
MPAEAALAVSDVEVRTLGKLRLRIFHFYYRNEVYIVRLVAVKP